MVARLKNNNQPSLQKNTARSLILHFRISEENCFSNFEGFKSIFFHFKKIKDIMRTSNSIRLAVCIFSAIVLLSWIGPYDNTTHTPNIAMSGSTATKNFTVTAPPLNANSNLSDPPQRYKVFFFTGDGSYMLDEVPANTSSNAIWTYSHTYSAGSGTCTPHVETTDIYDDDTNPPGRMALSSFPGGISNNPSTNVNLGAYAAIITPVRRMVTDHALTYIVTYENPDKTDNLCETISGNVEFTFDISKIDYTDYEEYPESAIVNAANESAGKLLIPFTNLAKGKQINTFLNFTTTGQYQQTVTPPTAKLIVSSGTTSTGGSCTFPESYSRTFSLSNHSVIESAHDPNRKSVWLEEANGQQYLVYLIDFQNDGADTVKDVTITDELDVKLKNCVLGDANLTFSPNRGYLDSQSDLSNGFLKIIRRNIKLPGLGQPDYGVAFGEPETKGSVKIKIPLAPGCPSTYLPCDAILNRASIRFDCNPPIETNLAIFNLNCAGNWAILDTTATLICADTLLPSDTIQFPAPIPGGGVSLLDAATAQYFDDPDNGFHCQWYPASGLSGATTASAIVTEYKNKTYTMVASKNCQRYILHRTVVVPCAIGLNATVQADGANYDVTLTVTNPSGNPLQWQDCTSVTSNSWSIDNLKPGKYYFSVYDPLTGCYAEQWVTLCGDEPTVTDTPNDCTADLQVSGGNPPYSFQWEWNGQPQTFNGQSLSLSWKSNVQVTVTDSNGCSTVFQPVPGNCGWWNNWWFLGGVILLAVAITGYAIFSFFQKN